MHIPENVPMQGFHMSATSTTGLVASATISSGRPTIQRPLWRNNLL
jgi:hypothetical protein